MSGYDNLKKRLEYHGGNADGRMSQDKLRGLKQSLSYSYQDVTVVLEDGREFRALINPNKDDPNYDNKILSIPYEDICLNSNRIEKTNIKVGDTVTWKENNTHWLVHLQYLGEEAYFRAQIRRCDQQVEINGKKYWTFIKGSDTSVIDWNNKEGIYFNNLNYKLIMYITKDENTFNNLHRFSKVKITEEFTNLDKTWEVQGVNPYFGDGIIEVFLKEYFENELQDKVDKKRESSQNQIEPTPTQAYIDGPKELEVYESATYIIKGLSGGDWYIVENNIERLYQQNKDSIVITIKANKSKNLIIRYKIADIVIDKNIKLLSF